MTKNVGLVFSEDFYTYNFGDYHPLRPLRLELTIKLMELYGLLKDPKLKMLPPRAATTEELYLVHDRDYVETVRKYSSQPQNFLKDHPRGIYGLGTMDDPVFPGMFEASALVAGASIVAGDAVMNDPNIDHAFNFGGGLHHAARNKAHGFCIFNDAAIAIQKIRLKHPNKKIMYLDIDAHHGDGVQWIFYKDSDVLKLSIHQDGNTLFPGTGFMEEIGEGQGINYTVNIPIYPGTYDDAYIDMFRIQIPRVMETFKPDLLVTQLGVDTYFQDPLTMLGLSTSGHEKLYKLIHDYVHEYCGGKWLALGGGGYLMNVVPRSWTMALATMLEVSIPNNIPEEWVEIAKKRIDDEEIPYQLRDKNFRVEEQLLKNPMFPVNIEKRLDEIDDFIKLKVVPALKAAK